MSIVSSIIVMIPFLVIALGIPLIIGVYVYQDARSRSMNAVLWTVIAIFAPSLIGFIIYLIVRGNYSDLQCPNCNTRITEQYIVCPKCGAKLKPSCTNCGMAVEQDWKVCPRCAQPLPEYQDDIVIPVKPKDRALWKILIAVIIVPILLVIVLVAVFSMTTTSGGIGMAEIAKDDYLEAVNEPQIAEWLEECDKKSEEAYALEYKTEYNEQKQVRYLIYIPDITERFNYAPNPKNGLFGTTLEIELENVGGETGKRFILITYTGNSYADLEVELDDEKLDCEITEVDFSVVLSDYDGKMQDDVNVYEEVEIIEE